MKIVFAVFQCCIHPGIILQLTTWKTEALSFFAVKTVLLLKAGTSLQSYYQWVLNCLNGGK